MARLHWHPPFDTGMGRRSDGHREPRVPGVYRPKTRLGIAEQKKLAGPRMPASRLIERAPTIVVACDVDDLDALDQLAGAANRCPAVGALKIGFTLVGRFGIARVAERIRKRSPLPIIYDHQKAGTDIPDIARAFVQVAEPVDAVIVFPMAGPAVQRSFITSLVAASKTVIVGALMTHPQFLESDGGYLANSAPSRILELATELGVTDFVVPATSPQSIVAQRQIIERKLPAGRYDLYSPGLITQGGRLSDLRLAAGQRWHGIVGRAVYEAPDPETALREIAALLLSVGAL